LCIFFHTFLLSILALRDPHHDDHNRLRTWVGAHFDPELFSVQQLNSAFAVE
jgi:hypothetical protein